MVVIPDLIILDSARNFRPTHPKRSATSRSLWEFWLSCSWGGVSSPYMKRRRTCNFCLSTLSISISVPYGLFSARTNRWAGFFSRSTANITSDSSFDSRNFRKLLLSVLVGAQDFSMSRYIWMVTLIMMLASEIFWTLEPITPERWIYDHRVPTSLHRIHLLQFFPNIPFE